RIRTLDLEAVVRAVDGLAVRARIGARIVVQTHVPFAVRGLEANPVGGRRATDEDEFLLGLAEDDHVTDHMAIGGDGYEVLRHVGLEVGETVDAHVAEKLFRIRTFDRDFVHVVGLVEQHGGVAPCHLFGTPVGKFRCYYRVYVDTGLVVAQQIDRAASGGNGRSKAVVAHLVWAPGGRQRKSRILPLPGAY